MRKLTKDQITSILGIYANNQIESVVIYINKINIYFKNNYEFNDSILYKYKDPIKEWLKKELSKLPEEARQHVEYLTCHPTVIVEISFPDHIKSITDGLRPGIEADQKFKDGYWRALIDIRSKENMNANNMPLGNAGLGGGLVNKKSPSGGW